MFAENTDNKIRILCNFLIALIWKTVKKNEMSNEICDASLYFGRAFEPFVTFEQAVL